MKDTTAWDRLKALIEASEKAGKQVVAIYIAAKKECADDISPVLARLYQSQSLLKKLLALWGAADQVANETQDEEARGILRNKLDELEGL